MTNEWLDHRLHLVARGYSICTFGKEIYSVQLCQWEHHLKRLRRVGRNWFKNCRVYILHVAAIILILLKSVTPSHVIVLIFFFRGFAEKYLLG